MIGGTIRSEGPSRLFPGDAPPLFHPRRRGSVRRPSPQLLRRSTSLLACIFAATVVWACDEGFSPLAPSEVQLSVFGYLDASADTQWVRVMPIRPLMLTSPDSFGVTVTLERLGGGRIVELRDSVFRFSHYANPELGSEGAYLHNFWTTERIEPGATYRFSARRAGEDEAEALVEIPPDYQVEVWLRQGYSDTDYLQLEGLNHVPFLTANAHFNDRCGYSVDTVRVGGDSGEEGVHLIPIQKSSVTPREGCGRPEVEKRELWIVGAESEWPSGQEYSPGGLAITERASNVTNAIGFLGGVLTKVIPYESCEFQGGGAAVPDHCKLRYDEESVTLIGKVRETRCGDGPIDSVTVELREIDGEPPALRKVRTTLSNRAGEFQIGALEAGMRYFLKARAKPEPDPFWGEVDVYTLHTDTVTFMPGEQAQYNVELQRLTQCAVER